MGKTGRDLVGAAIACYGTRTTIILYNTQVGCVEELTLMKIGNKEKWIVTNPKMELGPKAKLFSFATKGIMTTLLSGSCTSNTSALASV